MATQVKPQRRGEVKEWQKSSSLQLQFQRADGSTPGHGEKRGSGRSGTRGVKLEGEREQRAEDIQVTLAYFSRQRRNAVVAVECTLRNAHFRQSFCYF